MKASKILAGLSAAAIAGSMLSMVSVSADGDAVAWFANQYVGWASKDVDIVEGTADYDLSPDSAATGFTNLGYVQSAADHEAALEAGTTVTVNYIEVNDIKFTNAGGELTGGENNGLMNEWWGDNGADIVSDDESATIVFAATGLTLEVNGEATDITKVSYNITATVDSDAIQPFEAPDDAIFFNKGWDITAANPADAMAVSEDWMNDGFQFQVAKDGFKADLSNAVVSIVVQSDVAYDKDAVVFKYIDLRDFPDGDLNFFSNGDEKDNVYKVDIPWTKFVDLVNVGTNGAGLWIDENTGDVNGGQIMIQTMQVKADEEKGLPARNINLWAYITGVEYTEDVEEPSDSVDFKIDEGISFNKPYLFDPTEDLDEETEYTSATFKLKGIYPADRGDDSEVSWNTWCTYFVKITDAKGNVTWRVIKGSDVGWDFTVDDKGTEDKEDDEIIPNNDPRVFTAAKEEYDDEGNLIEGTGGDVEFKIPFAYGTTVEFIAQGWSDEGNEGDGDIPYILLESASIGFEKVDEPTPVDPTPVDPTPVTPLPGPGTDSDVLDSSSTAPNGGSTNSNTSSGSTSSAAAGKSGDSNPATGAAALGTVGVLLAGAAMAVSKKRK